MSRRTCLGAEDTDAVEAVDGIRLDVDDVRDRFRCTLTNRPVVQCDSLYVNTGDASVND